MKEMVFLLEEPSAKALLSTLIPRFLDPSIALRYIAFEGKQDLEKQLERKLRGYTNPQARFLVLRDQDSADCHTVKAALIAKCAAAGRGATSLVRIACHELETFYLADLAAVETAIECTGLSSQQASAKFRAPDYMSSPSHELSRLTHNRYQKVSHSRVLGEHLDLDNTRSSSFAQLIAGIRRLEVDLLALPDT
jgi:hypothetical protein